MKPNQLLPGQSQKEIFFGPSKRRRLIAFDYRHGNGQLFSCVAHDSMDIYDKLQAWAAKNGFETPLDIAI